MSKYAVHIENMSKMYRLYRRNLDRVFDAFGVNNLLFWRKNYYQEFWALRDINIEVKRGDRLGIIGRNGAGKSTLLKIITGNVPPSEGSIQVNGNVQALMELGTGFHPEFSGRENIHASLAYQGMSPTLIRQKEEEIIDFAEIEKFIDQPVKTYSAGMYARLAFSTATAIEPEILIIDEILGAGDAYFAGKSLERMMKLTKEVGATVLFVSHDLASVQRLCNHSVWIDRGRVVAEGDTLHVSKLYAASIREQDETRLRARNLRLKQQTLGTIDLDDPAKHQLVLHFITEGWDAPKEKHPIHRLALYEGERLLSEIKVGDAMDNDINQNSHVMTNPGYIDWSKPYKHGDVFVRSFENAGGQYKHAAMVLGAQDVNHVRDPLRVLVEFVDTSREDIHLEIYDDDAYVRLGTVPGRETGELTELFFEIPQSVIAKRFKINGDDTHTIEDVEVVTKPAEPFTEVGSAKDELGDSTPGDVYGSSEMQITDVKLLDGDMNEKHIFDVGEQLIIRTSFKSNIDTDKFVFGLVTFSKDGIMVHRWLSLEDKVFIKRGEHFVDVVFEKIPFGPRDYVLSIALYPEFDDRDSSIMQPAYSVWDRKIGFRVAVPEGIPADHVAFIHHDVTWSLTNVIK